MAFAITLAAAAPGEASPPEDDTTRIGETIARAEEVPDGEKIKCRYIKELGSRIPNRICRTRAEWSRIETEQREAAVSNMRGGGQRSESGVIYGSN
jgi:hypothetical protein